MLAMGAAEIRSFLHTPCALFHALCESVLLGVCVVVLLEFAELAKPAEMPRRCCNTHCKWTMKRPPRPRRVAFQLANCGSRGVACCCTCTCWRTLSCNKGTDSFDVNWHSQLFCNKAADNGFDVKWHSQLVEFQRHLELLRDFVETAGLFGQIAALCFFVHSR